MGQSKFSNGLTFWFISIENSGKQNSNNTLRVEINQFCDSRRHTVRISYADLYELFYYTGKKDFHSHLTFDPL